VGWLPFEEHVCPDRSFDKLETQAMSFLVFHLSSMIIPVARIFGSCCSVLLQRSFYRLVNVALPFLMVRSPSNFSSQQIRG
jgi:hypothetical protein